MKGFLEAKDFQMKSSQISQVNPKSSDKHSMRQMEESHTGGGEGCEKMEAEAG